MAPPSSRRPAVADVGVRLGVGLGTADVGVGLGTADVGVETGVLVVLPNMPWHSVLTVTLIPLTVAFMRLAKHLSVQTVLGSVGPVRSISVKSKSWRLPEEVLKVLATSLLVEQ